ncbi:MAG: M23 family metallopeptidase [Rhodospirillaceae bacterium]
MTVLALSAAMAALAPATPVRAQASEPPRFGLPIDCHLGGSCWLVNLVDLDSGPGVRDYACGRNAYDGHKGVDIAVRDGTAMERGVPVLAAAEGVVKAGRDGMPDQMPDKTFRETKKNLYCGNGIVIDHGGGWETQYCHMRWGSVAVKPGDKVDRGQKIGMVGHSGMAEFPHVHLSVRHRGRVIDPFLGLATPAAGLPASCGRAATALWTKAAAQALARPMTEVFNAGFAAQTPKALAIRDGLYHAKALSRRSPVLIFWAETWWVRAGDRMTVKIVGPDGAVVVEHASTLEKDQAIRMVYAGRKKPGLFWPAGTYVGTARLSRAEGGAMRHFDARREVIMRD